MRLPFHSIRWRVQAWHGAILLLVIVAFCLAVYQLAWTRQSRRIDRTLFETERALMGALMRANDTEPAAATARDDTPPPSPAKLLELLRMGTLRLPADFLARFETTEPGFIYFSVRDANERVLVASANAPGSLDYLPIPPEGLAEEVRTTGHRRELLRSGAHGMQSLVGRDITPDLEDNRRFVWSLGGSGLAVWLVGLLGGWWLAGRAIRPIETISRTASRIAAGNLRERISTSGTDSELDQLGRVLNETFARLQAAFEQQKQFTADASHELRTPVTVLLAETRRMLKRDRERSPEEYLQVLQTCHDAASRMRQLIEALLLLAHEEREGSKPRHDRCDLAAIARESVQQLTPLAAARGIELHTALQSVPCRGDAAALAVVASNLVANAIHHHAGQGNVWITCGEDAGAATLVVRDDGPGIPPEHLPHIFQRFYRADPARTSSGGRSGLGLAIVQTIVANHGGRVTAASTPGHGACFTVTLPLAAVA